ncbi:hypothetical protein [Ralstonia solanacearum]|nr:hypothetical protein [Ralstonia solanacearum]
MSYDLGMVLAANQAEARLGLILNPTRKDKDAAARAPSLNRE